MCPTYECIPPSTTIAPPTCPAMACPESYEVQVTGDLDEGGCPHYDCIPPENPIIPCVPAQCQEGYDLVYPNPSSIHDLCPEVS